ncbi:IS110 family RNA-guided transposase [Sinomonas albida]|uniref:IS110 family transposase n=1 Tax=Sinomonas albida TaxID=369942 RepID=UPI0010A93F89|nr:IS110 family transposase [Sinomonas albida]
MAELWAGIDAGKTHHHCVLIDQEGARLLSRRLANTEEEILTLIADVLDLAAGREVHWATDLNQGGAALLISALLAHTQTVFYIPGRVVHHAARTYSGEGKTDAKDAAIIADQARMRHGLQQVRAMDETIVELRLLTARRTDLVHDRTRSFNRLRATLLEYFPALEAAFDFSQRKGAVILLTKYQTAERIRRAGRARIEAWLRKQGCSRPDKIAEAAVAAAEQQSTTVVGHTAAAALVARIAGDVLSQIEQITEVETEIKTRLQGHAHFEILTSVPGFGPQLAAEFIAAIGGSMDRFASADHLAGIAGVAPVPRDSGKVSGNLRRPKRYDRRLLRVCFLAAQSAARYCPESRTYYERKRAEGKNHKQAVLALARRRINVIWALLRDGTTFHHRKPEAVPLAA